MVKVQTVRGSIEPDELGITLPHEHLIFDFTNWLAPLAEASKLPLIDAKVNLKNLSELRRNGLMMKDNLRLSDVEVAIEELKAFKGMGGNSLVDLTLPGAGRDILALRRISEDTRMNIVAGTGWYLVTSHPPKVKQMSVEELGEIIIQDLVEGIDDTGIRAGAIGEIGCSFPSLHPDENKVLQAAAQAQRETGACIWVHPAQWGTAAVKGVQQPLKEGHMYLDIIEKEGGNLEKVVMCHMDAYSRDEIPLFGMDLDYHRSILNRGVTIEYDWFGRHARHMDNIFPGASCPSDRERIAAVVELCKQGYDKQILMSQDVCMKIHLTIYGGQGYAYILRRIVPALKYAGVTSKQIRSMLVKNPKRLLSF